MEQQKTALAFFDFDGTMIQGDSIVPYLGMARKRGDISLITYLKGCICGVMYVLKMMDGGVAKSRALAFYHHLPMKQKNALDQAFVHQYLLPRVYPKAKEAVARHKNEGRHTILVSASTENYMQYVAPALGFDALLCTPFEADGRIRHNCHGIEKVRRIENYLISQQMQADLSQSYAYGDSKGDLPMLRLCGHPIIANGKKALLKAAPEIDQVHWKK